MMPRVFVQVKIWFQNRRSKVKKMMKQHQHGGPVGNNSAGGANGGGGAGSGGGLGPTGGGESHVHGAGGLPPRDCWSHQPPASHQHDQHQLPGRRAPDDDPSPPRRDAIDDDDDEPTKKPLHLLQLQTAMHRFSPPEHGHHAGGTGAQLKTGGVPSYRGSPTPLHPVPPPARYHHAQHGTPMASPIHAWPDAGVDMLPHGLQHSHGQQQQQQRLHPAPVSNQPSPYPSSAYMMTSPDMTSTYQSWYPGSAQQMHQLPAHHLSTLLS